MEATSCRVVTRSCSVGSPVRSGLSLIGTHSLLNRHAVHYQPTSSAGVKARRFAHYSINPTKPPVKPKPAAVVKAASAIDRKPIGFWKSLDNQRAHLEELGKELGVKKPADWYEVPRAEIAKRAAPLFRYHSTIYHALKALYPKYPWDENGFKRPNRKWSEIDYQKEFLEKVAKELGVKQIVDWYSVTRKMLTDKGGTPLFAYYESVYDVLRNIYPGFPWDPKQFPLTPVQLSRQFDDIDHQRKHIAKISKKLGIKELSDWYTVSKTEVAKNGGRPVTSRYKSFKEMLAALYPDFPWDPSRFKKSDSDRAKKAFWKDDKNVLKAIERFEKKTNITKPEDWYSVALSELRDEGFPQSIKRPRLASLLMAKHPDFAWDKSALLRPRMVQQRKFIRTLEHIFPGIEIKINDRTQDLINPETGQQMELDAFIPSLNLAFEYQERHHYMTADYGFQPTVYYQKRDALKKQLAEAKGLTLITIPFWWNNTVQSLIATIKKARPDLFKDVETSEAPIPEAIPKEALVEKTTETIEGVGQPSTACYFTLSTVNPTNWWLFEKYDGIRGFWNPEKKIFYSRHGNQLNIPQRIIDSMPNDTFLDGEIWFGRNSFQEAMKVIYCNKQVDWEKFKYMVFDIPNHPGPYKERYAKIEEIVKENNFIEVAHKVACKDFPHFEEFYQDILEQGGEGVILRDPEAPWAPGRAPGFLKHKKTRDAEAKIVSAVGLNEWECELPNGVRFVAASGSSEFIKRYQPQPGDIVTFKHRGILFSSKKPKSPSLYRIRKDVTWEQVVAHWQTSAEGASPTGVPVKNKAGGKRKPKNFWQDVNNLRRVLEEFATKVGIDPRDPQDWGKVTIAQLKETKEGTAVVRHGIRKALEEAFPDVDFVAFPRRTVKQQVLAEE